MFVRGMRMTWNLFSPATGCFVISRNARDLFFRGVFGGCAVLFGSSATFAQNLKEASPSQQIAFFESRIRPVLIEHCYECHSADSKIVQGNLFVDSRSGLLRGGDSGPSLVPNRPSESILLKALRYEESQMPPKGKLSDEILRDFEKWIADGAVDPREEHGSLPKKPWVDPEVVKNHWAFQSFVGLQAESHKNSVDRLIAESVNSSGWSVEPSSRIDVFVDAILQRKGMVAAGEADPLSLLRRLSFDLTGLPPTQEEIEHYLSDGVEDRYERSVDRLLASPQYGVRWARYWLDTVRYANSNGADENHEMPNAWRYRDWVIEVLNEDKGFDEFVIEQIAGDLLPIPEAETARNRLITATGFWVLGPKMLAEQDKAKMQIDIVDEQIDTFSRTMLGVTLSCARCHDHKFDPFTQQDYFALAGILMSTRTMADQAFVSNWMERPLVTKAREQERELHQGKIDQASQVVRDLLLRLHQDLVAQGKLATLPENPSTMIKDGPYTDEMKKEIEAVQKELEILQKGMPDFDKAMAVEEAKEMVDLPVHLRGNHLKVGAEKISRGVPKVLTNAVAFPEIPSNQSGRLQLASWLTDSRHPLMARVIVNRVWMWHFGQPLVASPSNFGLKGEQPSHPELLDDLAMRWMEQGWSLKWLHREILLSKAYRRTSRDSRYEEIDPDNRWLWRQNSRRLEMEPIRDSLLACSSRLDMRFGPPQAKEGPRRSTYLNINRAALEDTFSVFDYVDPASHIEQRAVTTVPSQALFFLNNATVTASAESLAQVLINESQDNRVVVENGYRTLFGRKPSPKEVERALLFLEMATKTLGESRDGNEPVATADAGSLRREVVEAFIHGLFSAREFIWIE